ncbi:MAG: hypothetical protein ACE5KV_04510 [Thermoplasmata archaeon]
MENVAEKILSPRFIEEELTDRIHEMLARKYVTAILRYLKDHPEGVGFRQIDVEVVGAKGSVSTTRNTLKDLIDVGWVEQKEKSPYFITEKGKEALIYSRKGEGLISNGNGGGGE